MSQANRRDFLRAAAAAGSLAIAGAAPAQPRAGEQSLRMGVIGTGWYGMVDAKAALKVGGIEVVAVCDVDSQHADQAADELEKLQGRRPQTFKLYQEMLDTADLDIAVIGSPPHWHALHLLACLEHGLDVYVEKPLAYDVREGRALVEAVQGQPGRIVQVGFQRRQSKAYAEVAEYIRAGKIGKVVQVDAQINFRAGILDHAPREPPPSLDWDLWCGPAPRIPYSPQVGHKHWRLEKTTGHGHLVDWGIHHIDAVRMILRLGAPVQITAAGGLHHHKGKITTPDSLTVHFEFESLPLVWRHRLWGATEYSPKVSNGIFFYGEEATIFATDRRWVVIPKDPTKNREAHEAPADMNLSHMANFLECVRNRQQPACPIEDAHRSTTAVQLAMIAYESNSVVSWDEAAEQIPGNPAAAVLLKRDYRGPYEHPYRA